LIDKSDQFLVDDVDHNLPYLEEAARNLVRLFDQLKHWRKSFAYIAHNVVAAYVIKLQQTTVLPSVKRILTEGIFHIVELCQANTLQMLRHNLPSNTHEIYHQLWRTYNRQYVYKGRV